MVRTAQLADMLAATLLTPTGRSAGAQHSRGKIARPAGIDAVHCNKLALMASRHRWQLTHRVRLRSHRRGGPATDVPRHGRSDFMCFPCTSSRWPSLESRCSASCRGSISAASDRLRSYRVGRQPVAGSCILTPRRLCACAQHGCCRSVMSGHVNIVPRCPNWQHSARICATTHTRVGTLCPRRRPLRKTDQATTRERLRVHSLAGDQNGGLVKSGPERRTLRRPYLVATCPCRS